MGYLALIKQPIIKKENSEFRLTVLLIGYKMSVEKRLFNKNRYTNYRRKKKDLYITVVFYFTLAEES